MKIAKNGCAKHGAAGPGSGEAPSTQRPGSRRARRAGQPEAPGVHQRRTPFKPPLYPSEAWQIIEDMILPHMELVTLGPKEYREVVHHCAINGWAGGRIHDAIHLRCAQKAGCDRIYTFNVKDFRALAPSNLAGIISAP